MPVRPDLRSRHYRYIWGPRGNMPGAMSRKGQRCRMLVRGAMNSALIEFDDGYQAVVSRNALRQWCHLHYDAEHYKETRKTRKDKGRPLLR